MYSTMLYVFTTMSILRSHGKSKRSGKRLEAFRLSQPVRRALEEIVKHNKRLGAGEKTKTGVIESAVLAHAAALLHKPQAK